MRKGGDLVDIYVGRQPIFDKTMRVYGYELLYRKSMNNFYEGIEDNQSTATLLNNTFLTMSFTDLTGGKRAFINFTDKMLLEDVPALLPKDIIVVEILERVEVTPQLIEACNNLRRKGYILALDDFVFAESYKPLVDLAHIIKVDFAATTVEEQKELIESYKDKVSFLAERIETREDYEIAVKLGYKLFQGYFFSKPVILKSSDIAVLNTSLVRVVNILNEPEPDFQKITEAIELDLGLSYKLLRIANTVQYAARGEIHSLKNALVRLGVKELNKWIYLIMLNDLQKTENAELLNTTLVRAKFMEQLAIELGLKGKHFECFMVGMFSTIDVLLNRDMKDILAELPLTREVKDALLGENNQPNKILQAIINYEQQKLEKINIKDLGEDTNWETLWENYLKAIKWVNKNNLLL